MSVRGASEGIDHSGPVPKHSQLREILLGLIESTGAAHSAIPSERDLVQRYGLSRMTVRQAVDALVAEGRLYRVPAKGTFIAPPKIVMPLQLTSFTADMRARGHVPGAVDLGRHLLPATDAVAAALDVRPGDPIVVIERLRTADGEPMAIERAHLPAALVPGLLEQPLEGRSLYVVLHERYGMVLDHGEQTIEAVAASAEDADLLHVPRGHPVLLLVRRSWVGGRPVEHVVSTYRGDRYQLRVALQTPVASLARSAAATRPVEPEQGPDELREVDLATPGRERDDDVAEAPPVVPTDDSGGGKPATSS